MLNNMLTRPQKSSANFNPDATVYDTTQRALT